MTFEVSAHSLRSGMLRKASKVFLSPCERNKHILQRGFRRSGLRIRNTLCCERPHEQVHTALAWRGDDVQPVARHAGLLNATELIQRCQAFYQPLCRNVPRFTAQT